MPLVQMYRHSSDLPATTKKLTGWLGEQRFGELDRGGDPVVGMSNAGERKWEPDD
jgi:hypothetical protein